LSLFGTKLIFRGLGDLQTLRSISELVGDHEVPVVTESVSTTLGRGSRKVAFVAWRNESHARERTYSRQREPQLPPSVIAQGKPGMVLVLRTGKPWSWVRCTPWFNSSPWREVVSADSGLRGGDRQRRKVVI
jgi:hypothetical protein